MLDVERSPEADADLAAILDYGVGRWGVDAALAFVFSFETAYQLIGENPRIGPARPEIGEEMRSWGHRGYILYYRVERDRIWVVRILHGAADTQAIDE